jgi:hypothetical protein
MSDIRKNIKCLLNQWIKLYNRDTIVFTTDENVVYCQVFNCQVPCSKKFQITHVYTSFLTDSLKRSLKNKKQMLLENVYKSKTNNFNEDLCLSLIATNIPY